ncbi:hypothetical protein HUU53_04570 [Candidatus Micrarchaeota archaeon]|nr:hypothetical protein [Candidatus Micrarchaeota archaeon]
MSEIEEVSAEVRELQKTFKDPVVIGQLLHDVAEERRSSNLLLKEIMARLEKIEDKIASLQGVEEQILADVDKEIVDFVSEKPVTAKEVQAKFNYSGSNGASARLNNLVRSGVLQKKQVGRKVYFQLKSH